MNAYGRWWFIALVGALAMPGHARAADAPRKPNIVYFMIDELGYYETSYMGHPDLRTPNLDQLAAEGTRFTQCLAGGPVCARRGARS